MKVYPEYKSSGIDWLGEIPSHWNRMPIKAVLSKSSAGTWGEEPREDGSDIICFRVADFDYQHLELSHKNLTYRNVDERQLFGREVCKGDIVIEKSGGGDLWPVGRAVISKFDIKATCSNFMHVISTNDKANNLYLNYLLATIYMHGINRQYFAQTTGIQNLNIKEYLSQQAWFPPIDEQEAIAAYLDDVTEKVDALIAEKRKQVEDLRSYRTSLITETVTRGLNHDVPLRSSGIGWLGDIPEHWEMVKIGWLFDAKAGGDAKPDLYSEEQDANHPYPVYTNTLIENQVYAYSSEAPFKAGSITVTGRGDIGHAFIRKVDFDAIIRLIVLTPKTEQNCEYFKFFIDEVIPFFTDSAAVGQLSASQIVKYRIVVPPLAEQQKIADFLDARTAKIDALISELEKQLEELAEYKKAVISEAVTGKVDVRDWKPQN